MMEKEKKVWTEIIEMYKDMPFLWDKTNFNYLNRDMRQSGFEAILEVYKLFDSEATVPFLKKKMENMRTTYSRELKKVKASKRKGQKVYVPMLWYFDLLHFLVDNIQPCGISNDDSEVFNEDSQDTSSQQSSMQQTSTKAVNNKRKLETTPPKIIGKRYRRTFLRKPISSNKVLSTVQKVVPPKEEEWEVFGRSIGLQLKDLDKHQLTIAQKLISDTIFYAKTGKLCEDSSISLQAKNQCDLPTSSYRYQNDSPRVMREGSFSPDPSSPECKVNPLDL